MTATPDPRMPSLFAQIAQGVRGILPVLFAGTGIVALSGILPEGPVSGILSLVISMVATALVAYAATLFVLSDGAVAGSEAMGRIRSRSGQVFAMAWVFPFLVLLLVEGIVREVSGGGQSASGRNPASFIGLIEALVFLLALARYGTVYPAIAGGGDASLAAAGARGPGGPVFWRLLGASFFGGAILTMVLVFLAIGGSVTGAGPFALSVVMRMVSVFGTLCIVVAMAVILCNAYRGLYAVRAS